MGRLQGGINNCDLHKCRGGGGEGGAKVERIKNEREGRVTEGTHSCFRAQADREDASH